MDEKELKQLTTDINSKFDQFNDSIAKSDEKLEAKHKELTQSIEKLAKENGEQAAKYQKQLDAMDAKMQESLLNTKKGQMTVNQQLKEALNSDGYKAAVKAKVPYEFEVKANEITTSNSFTETNGPVIARMYEPGVVTAPQRPTPVWDALNKGVMTSDYAIVVERSSQTISAAQANEAGAFGQSYSAYTTYKYGAIKIAEHIKTSVEKLEDWEYIRSEINDQLITNIPHIREGYFLTGYYSTENWLGLINTTSQVAKSFAKPTGLDAVASVNRFDVLRAAILQCELGNSASLANKQGYTPNLILVNPADAANLQLVKDTTRQYVLPPFSAQGGVQVGGVRVVPTIYMTAGKFLVGDFTQAKAWVKRGLTIKMWDQNSTDPIYDLVTFTASHRLAFGVGATKAYAFVYGDFEDALSLIAS